MFTGSPKQAISAAVLALLLLGITDCSTAQTRAPADDNPWTKILTPTSAAENPIGFYSAGCLDGGTPLAFDGKGYQVMRLSRHRYYGTRELIGFIQTLAEETQDQKIGTILIGDMSQPRGGPMPPDGHASHQVGLDVDIWFWLQPDAQTRPLTAEERETVSAISMVDMEKRVIDRANWKPEHVKMLELTSKNPMTERIFVNPVIKRELCKTLPASEHGWLHKIRPWYDHNDHFHVRLVCPKNAPDCTHQDPVPAGDGCGSDLDWWFSPEEREAEKQIAASSGTKTLPKLPAACEKVLNF